VYYDSGTGCNQIKVAGSLVIGGTLVTERDCETIYGQVTINGGLLEGYGSNYTIENNARIVYFRRASNNGVDNESK
jgi:hypothetical protein